MAYYAALVSVLELLKEINNADHQYPSSILDQQIHVSLYEKFNLLQELLGDYSPKDHKDAAVVLESRIRVAAYEAQDIVESHISDQIPAEDTEVSSEDHKPRTIKRIFRCLISAFPKATRPCEPQRFEEPILDDIAEEENCQNLEKKYYQDLEKVKAEVDSIVGALMRIKLESQSTHENLQTNFYNSAQESNIEEALTRRNTMVGFEENLTTIKGELCGESSRLETISIVGMGGLGKTTLARNVFDDKLVKEHFDCHGWITISQDYHLRNILLAIVYSLNIYQRELSEVVEEELIEKIYKHLFGRRYLIVMDDMWETRVWDDMKRVLPMDSNGSRILITTRLSHVAHYADTCGFLHELQFLDNGQSWNLFCQKVFCPPKLEDIGKLIAKNCRGLPLAIVVVAGLLSKVNNTRHDWEEIARTVSSVAIDHNDEHLSKVLSLSYNHLPHYLKPCFLYLGGFPEDYEIHVSTLIRLWVVEGFLKPVESKSLEAVAEEYLEDLANRNLVLITKKKSNGKPKYCIIHDLLRDLCSQRARQENFLHCLHKEDDFRREPIENVRRLYIQMWDDTLFCEFTKENVSHVRAILSFAEVRGQDRHHFLSVASGFKLLHELDAQIIRFYSFPNVIVELLHLRYLALGASGSCIPPSIVKLQNLRTLIVCDGVIVLPCEIWKMPQLRHLVFNEVILQPIPHGEIRIIDGVPLLERLQTLERVKDFRFTSGVTKVIPNLKKLKVYYTGLAKRNWEKFGLNNLVLMRELETLEIEFSHSSLTATPIPNNFAFPSTLIKLSLVSCGLPWKDMRFAGLLPNLQRLKLKHGAFVGEEWEPIEGEFLKLKFLLMENLDLKYWRADDTHFPCLEQLHIRCCNELDEIPPEIGDVSTLQCIEVMDQSNPKLGSSALRIQEEQRDQGNDDFQVRVDSRWSY